MLSVSKPAASLVQQKKQQWAREREEMSQLYLPWGSGERCTNRPQVRNQFASTLELHKQFEYQEPLQRQRSPSLPPIHNIEIERNKDDRTERKSKEILNRNLSSAKRFAFYDEDAEGDTSGYGSETVNHIRSGLRDAPNILNPVIAWQQDNQDNNRNTQITRSESWSSRSPRPTAEEGRPRWGDRGVATGRLWEPTAPNARLPEMPNQKKGTPSWVERGLNMIENTADVLVIDQHSSSNSGGFECDRSSCNGSDEGRTFLRGQNVPIEPEIKAQRENKRMKALELQSAILTQLEDREKQRQAERERKLREERLEELRIQRQQEEDRQRLEEERRKNEEKQLKEQKKLETLKKALEEAEKKARQEKEKRFRSLKQKLSARSEAQPAVHENITAEVAPPSEPLSPTKSSRTYDVNSAKSDRKESISHQTTEFSSPRSAIAPSNLNLIIQNVPPIALTENQFNLVPIGINGNGELVGSQTNGLQLAVLLPQSLSNSLYSVSLNSLNTINESTETNKVLTPRKYRDVKTKDVATQTEPFVEKSTVHKLVETDEVERNIDKNYSKIDENAPQDTVKKDRRYRSEERYKKDLENRPKWGVNRPVAQYKKQSEKDPFYSQKRKMRQKYRVPTRHQFMSQSSEDSRSPSPPTRSEKTLDNNKSRNSLSQTYWKSKRSGQDIIRSSHDSEMTSLTSTDHNIVEQISANDISDGNKKSPKMSPSKRITLSQKFINDKYGNRKLWIDDTNDQHTKPTNIFDVENRKRIIDQINLAKREYLERNGDQENNTTKNKF